MIRKNQYELKTIIASDLTIEEVENLLTEFITDKIGFLISGRGEVMNTNSFETIHNKKCHLVSETGRPRCMYLNEDICKAINGCCFK